MALAQKSHLISDIDDVRPSSSSLFPDPEYHDIVHDFRPSPKCPSDSTWYGNVPTETWPPRNGFLDPIDTKRTDHDLDMSASIPSDIARAKFGKMKMSYADLIYTALRSQVPHQMTLRDLYQWFRDNTDKPKGNNQGWMNTIRFNLSLNQAFQRIQEGQSCWGLVDRFSEGVQPTHRYRNFQNKRSSTNTVKDHHMAPCRPERPRTHKAKGKICRQAASCTGLQYSNTPWACPYQGQRAPYCLFSFQALDPIVAIQVPDFIMQDSAWPWKNIGYHAVCKDSTTLMSSSYELPGTLGLSYAMDSNVPPNIDSLTQLYKRVREHVDEAMRTLPSHLLAMVVNIVKELADPEEEIDKLWEKDKFSDVYDLGRISKYTKLLK
ncbi:hypothetical protein CSUB01_07526 [Colletotrichum sublineola]|uniref:Fork-head domain-containing protein n=1 Tax=Colletotrichum sublineola TaxID=1173701 RepID=A0A066XIB6_COLSU|nr:hypothetical protein CSUB01_07526 [Colletotrichum sublineola]